MLDKHYTTTDTGLATFLIVLGSPLVSIDYTTPRYQFAFNDSEDIRKAADNYLTGTALVNAPGFLRTNKKLLRILHRQQQWEDD